LLTLAILAMVWDVPVAAQPLERTEHEVKAAFLYNFGKYVKWPESAADANSPFVICILGTDPFGKILDDIVSGNRVQNRPAEVRRLAQPGELADCEVAFISASERNNLERILQSLQKVPVLTVGDMPQFAERGGMINLTMEDNRVKFVVNVEAAERSGLTPSSQLLRLAKLVLPAKPAK
jgi:hypothetical protein